MLYSLDEQGLSYVLYLALRPAESPKYRCPDRSNRPPSISTVDIATETALLLSVLSETTAFSARFRLNRSTRRILLTSSSRPFLKLLHIAPSSFFSNL